MILKKLRLKVQFQLWRLKTIKKNLRYNKARRRAWRNLKANIPEPKSKLSSQSSNRKVKTAPFLFRQVFNEWQFHSATFTIIEKCATFEYKRLLQRGVADEIWENESGATVLVKKRGSLNVSDTSPGLQIALTTIVLTGFDFIEKWVNYYQSVDAIKAFYIYINASEAPDRLIQLEKENVKVQLIPWDFPYSIRKTHYHASMQEGHAQPSSIADAYYRAKSNGMTHLLPIDTDEYIFPSNELNNAPKDCAVHFLNANAKGQPSCKNVDFLSSVEITDPHDSSKNIWSGTGTSQTTSPLTFGKTLVPLNLNTPPPNIHTSSSFERAKFSIANNSIMLHFRELEGTRKYNNYTKFISLGNVNTNDYCSALWKHSAPAANKLFSKATRRYNLGD